MKIMSLNVNRFSGMEERDYTESITSLGKCPKANEIIAFVKGFLCGDPDGVVFLQEVPHWKGEGKGRDFKWVEERQLYQNFCKAFPKEQYRIILHNISAQSCTLAIVRESSAWELSTGFSDWREKYDTKNTEDYRNRFVEIRHAGLNLQFLGVHLPWQRKKEPNKITAFFNALENYAREKCNQRFAIVGDLNADIDEDSTYHDTLENIQRMEYKLAVVELGDKVITNFMCKTRIDHVLVSPSLKDSVTAEVKSQSELELSDHAVIIVNIEE